VVEVRQPPLAADSPTAGQWVRWQCSVSGYPAISIGPCLPVGAVLPHQGVLEPKFTPPKLPTSGKVDRKNEQAATEDGKLTFASA
jgi:hypothetical protein